MKRIEGKDLPYPWEIRYAQWQIKWILEPGNWTLIKINQWPFSIQDDAMKQAGVSHHAAFVMISEINIEIDERLESVKKDGSLCWTRYYDGFDNERIAKMFDVPYWRVGKRIYRAMRYICGKRKNCSYSKWIANGWKEDPKEV